MRKQARFAGAMLTLALAAAVLGPLTSMSGEGNPVNGTVWVANRLTSTIRAFDADTGDVLQTIDMAPNSQPGDLAVAKGKVYVAEEMGPSPAIAIVDARTGAILDRLFTGLGSRPHHVHASAGGNLVAVGLFGTDDVAVIDTHDDTLLGRWDTNPAHETGRIHAGVFSNDESTIYLANEAGGQVIAMDPRTGTVFWRLAVPAVHELAVTHSQKLLYVTRRGENALAVIRLDPDVAVEPDGYSDMLLLGAPDTLRLSANEQLLTVGLRTSPAQLAVVDTRSLAVELVNLSAPAMATTAGHQWTAPGGRYTLATFEGPGAGVAVIDHADGNQVVATWSYPGRPHGIDLSRP
jgi:DNA-binding beta-propeller fold protein YncE